MTFGDELIVYSDKNDDVIHRFGYRRRSREEFQLERWSVDSERNVYIYNLKRVDPRDPRVRYLMSVDGEPVVFELDDWGVLDVVATLRFAPASLQGREAELQALFKEGFAAGAEEFVGYGPSVGPVIMSFAPVGGAN